MEIVSPPYPKNGCTMKSMIVELANLHDWILEHQNFALHHKRELELDIPLEENSFNLGLRPTYSDMDRLLNVPIPDIATTWSAIRELRKKFDSMIRDFEDDWDCAYSVKNRVFAVYFAITVYKSAFMTYERKEMQLEDKKKEMLKQLKELFSNINGIKIDLQESEDVDFDSDEFNYD